MSEKVSNARLLQLEQFSSEIAASDSNKAYVQYHEDLVSMCRELRELRALAERAKYGEREG